MQIQKKSPPVSIYAGSNAAYELVKEELFKSVRIGTSIRVSKKSFDKWLDEQEL